MFQRHDLLERVVSSAVVTTPVLHATEVMPHAVYMYSLAVQGGLAVQEFDCLLHLECCNQRGGDTRRGNMAEAYLVAGQHRARKAILNMLSIRLIHRAFVASCSCRIENANNP